MAGRSQVRIQGVNTDNGQEVAENPENLQKKIAFFIFFSLLLLVCSRILQYYLTEKTTQFAGSLLAFSERIVPSTVALHPYESISRSNTD
jgi:hypothetical protein